MRILIADDHIEVRSAVHLMIEHTHPDWHVDEAAKISEINYLLQSTCPDILLLDWELPGLGDHGKNPSQHHKAMQLFESLCPNTVVVALSATPGSKTRALEVGVKGFVCKSDPPETLLNVISEIQLAV